MNEFYAYNAKYTCRACMQIGEDLRTMSNEEISLYENFVKTESVHTNAIMKICYICRSLFSKFVKFIQQCLKTNEIMNGVIKDNYHKYKTNYTCQTTTHYVGPKIEEPEFDDQFDNVEDKYDDDDVPLVILKEHIKEEFKVKKKRKDMQSQPNLENKEKTKAKKSKQKKPLKEGFTSRMVQETNEYEVIKLTKEQVLEEMVEKSKSEKYLRSVYKCEKCVKGFNFKDVIDNHMKKHSQEHGSLKCEICMQYCPSTVSLRGHMKSHTTRYKCKICRTVRISRQHLLEHYSIEHTFDASTYTCDHCPFTTKKRTVIQRHVKSHVAGRSLTCSACGAGFSNMHALRTHASRHDPAQRFSCGQCNMKFIYPSLLHRHMRTHTQRDHYCVECDVTFKSIDNLKLHFKRAKKHRDPSTYKYACSQCASRFVSPAAALAHLSGAHGAARSHACALCPRRYSSRESARSHERRAHRLQASRKNVLGKHRTRDPTHGSCGFSADQDTHKKQEDSENMTQTGIHET